MLLLRRTLALCVWCSSLILHHVPASADEESPLGRLPSTARPGNDPPASKATPFWSLGTPALNFPSLPSPSRWIPSIPSLSSLRPWGWSYEKKDVESTGTMSTAQPTEPSRTTETADSAPEEHSGSEEEVSATPQTSTTSPQKSLSSWAETGTIALHVTGTGEPTDTAHTSVPRSERDSPVPATHSSNPPSSRDDLFSLTPTHADTPAPTPTHALDSAQTRGNGSTTTQTIIKESKEDPGPQNDPFVTSVRSTIAVEATVPTATILTPQKVTTVNPALVETTLARHPFRSISSSTPLHRTIPTKPVKPNVSVSIGATEPAATESQPGQTLPDLGLSEAKAGLVEERAGVNTTVGREAGSEGDSAPSTAQSPRVNSPTPPETLDGDEEEEEEEDRMGVVDPEETGWDVETTRVLAPPPISSTSTTASTPLTMGNSPDTEDWLSDPTDSGSTFLPDCNQERSGICNSSDVWAFTAASPVTPAANATSGGNSSNDPFLIPAPSMFVPLRSDWASAMAAWGLAWEAHVYGMGTAFVAVTLTSALNLLCLPLRCPSGCGYFGLVSLFLLAAGSTRAFSLLYDAYGHRGLLPSAEASLLLYEAPFPCWTAAFGLVFLLLSMRSRMQLSYSAFQRPCVLACLVLLHFAAAFGPAALLQLSQRGGGGAPPCLLLSLVSRGTFVALASFLAAAYFVFYCSVRADSKHIYHLNNTSPTPAERYNRCPFAESRDWERAAAAVCLAALLSLACAGLQLYAMLHALGLAGNAHAFRPWPWWAFQFSCRACEVGVCLTLALVVAQPVYCADRLPQAGGCWTELLAAKSPIMAGSYQWTLGQQEKLAICGSMGHGETESLPLYMLVDESLGRSLNGLDLLYHSNRALAYRDLDPPQSAAPEGGGGVGATSGGSSLASDSTADLRPPSPINLRRSIDEALFSEALFPMSLFSPSSPFRCSDASLNVARVVPNGVPALGGTGPADPGLYRSSSCGEMAPPCGGPGGSVPGVPSSPSLSRSSSCSSPERWGGSSSSCSLCGPSLGSSLLVPRPGADQAPSGHAAPSSGHQGAHTQRQYRALGSASQESLDLDLSSEPDRSVQDEFMSVCRQIDALSICSETIDL